MARIRIGHFDQFKGEETLLLDCDPEGLAHLIEIAQSLAVGGEEVCIDRSSMAQSDGNIHLVACTSPRDIGLVSSGPLTFRWLRSREAWREVADKLSAIRDDGSSHQYLDGPRDALQVIASTGEYGEEWWDDVANKTVPADAAKGPPRG